MYSELASIGATKKTLEAFGLSAKYKLGQNFLVSDEIVGKIVRLAQLSNKDVVLEIGPGIGTLSLALLKIVDGLCSIEQDKDLIPVLKSNLSEYESSLCLINDDALKVGEQEIGQALDRLHLMRAMPNRLVSNLPYAIAATLILQYFQTFDFIEDMTVMVQSEVADRIAAQSSSKIYGAYTVKLALYADVVGRFQVSPQHFFPKPRVESSVIKLKRKDEIHQGLTKNQKLAVCKVIDAAFLQRRKTIRNSMSQNYPKELLDLAFETANIDSQLRAEVLELDDFIRLTKALKTI
ncbi:MAG: 16S rRNA (adenine(1518)-N(6)/adenine(1519)-N(6))-dimethyltransferase RsmA [Coriobacteriia bacterium]|nr:16S rRNA (adenine(1518)-N(6)/adenine(1519)-N(6))-dimethyltransferase RsmA [Coriobacteriia bacterium]